MDKLQIEQIKNSVNLQDLVQRYGFLPTGGTQVELTGSCPKCGGNDRFHVKTDWFFCRSCYPPKSNMGNDAIGFVRWIDGLSFGDAAKRLGAGVGDFVPASSPVQPTKPATKPSDDDVQRFTEYANDSHSTLLSGEGIAVPALQELERRGITRETAIRYRLGAGYKKHKEMNWQAFFTLTIPWIDSTGAVWAVNNRFLDVPAGISKYWLEKGSKKRLFGAHTLAGRSTLLLIEGELNCVAVGQSMPEIDVVSIGSQDVSPFMLSAAAELMAGYDHVLLWADEKKIIQGFKERFPGLFVFMSSLADDSPKMDACDWLSIGRLNEYLSVWLDAYHDLHASPPVEQVPAIVQPTEVVVPATVRELRALLDEIGQAETLPHSVGCKLASLRVRSGLFGVCLDMSPDDSSTVVPPSWRVNPVSLQALSAGLVNQYSV